MEAPAPGQHHGHHGRQPQRGDAGGEYRGAESGDGEQVGGQAQRGDLRDLCGPFDEAEHAAEEVPEHALLDQRVGRDVLDPVGGAARRSSAALAVRRGRTDPARLTSIGFAVLARHGHR